MLASADFVLAAVDPFAPDPEPVYSQPADTPVDIEVSEPSSASEGVNILDESWSTNPFERGWVNWTGRNDTGDLGWSAFEDGYLYEDDAYPATGDAYYGLASFGEEVQCSGTFSIGSTSAGGQYELVGFGMLQSAETYSYIYYDIYRKDLRYVKVIDNVYCSDLSPDFNISIPAGAEFEILMNRSGSDYQFILRYGIQSCTWSLQDTEGPSITEWYPSVALRYQGSRCYSLLVESGLSAVGEAGMGQQSLSVPVEGVSCSEAESVQRAGVSVSTQPSSSQIGFQGRTMSDIRCGINMIKSKVEIAYEDLLRNDPTAGGTISVSFSIAPDGSTVGVSISAPGNLRSLSSVVTSAVLSHNFGTSLEQMENIPVSMTWNFVPPE